MAEDNSESKKESAASWLKDRRNLLILIIIIFAFALRMYYFMLTKSQPLWWDEAAYGSLAKNIVFDGRWSDTFLIQKESFIRPMLFPIFWAVLLKVGMQEVGARFFLEFLPSILSVIFVYLIAKELYSKNVALISTFVFSTIWVHLFYTSRLMTDIPAVGFLFPSIYLFIKSVKGEFKAKQFAASIFLLSIATLIRYPIGLIFFSYLAFILITTKFKLLKNKKFWISGIIGILPILIFFLINYGIYGSIFPQLLSGEYYGKDTGQPKPPIAYNILSQIPNHLRTTFFILFILGSIIILFELIISYGLIKKNEKLKSHLFVLLLFLIFYSFFIFSVRAAEDRYLLPISVTFVIASGIGGEAIYNALKKYHKQAAVIVLLVIMLVGAYQELTYADSMIKLKKESFKYERIGFEWVRDNTPDGSVMFGRGTGPYSVYYAERDYLESPAEKNESFLETFEADYFVFNAYRPEREYVLAYIQEHQSEWILVQVFFLDEQQQQPAFVVYKRV